MAVPVAETRGKPVLIETDGESAGRLPATFEILPKALNLTMLRRGMSIDRSKIRWNGWGWAAHQDALASRDEVWTWLAAELGMPSLLATPARAIEDVTLPATQAVRRHARQARRDAGSGSRARRHL